MRKDEDLWDSFRKGDEAAYGTIFKNHYKVLLNYGLKIRPDEEEVEDCIQTLFADLWESRERLAPVFSLKSYLFASLRRRILRRITNRVVFSDIDKVSTAFYVEMSAELKHISGQVERDRVTFLTTLVQNLPDRQKEALYLKYYAGHSFAEIAQVMGITPRAVYKLVHKALDHLVEQIGDKKRVASLLYYMFL